MFHDTSFHSVVPTNIGRTNFHLIFTGPSSSEHRLCVTLPLPALIVLIIILICVVLAVQNMSACGAVSPSHEVEFHALEGSLNMMSKVLNDVLDLCVDPDCVFLTVLLIGCYSHRMDSGKFESFNQVLFLSRFIFAPCIYPGSPSALCLSSSHGITLHAPTT